MVMQQSVLDNFFSAEEQEEKIKEIKNAERGTCYRVHMRGEDDFSLVQTFFFLSKSPYTVKINGDSAVWIKG